LGRRKTGPVGRMPGVRKGAAASADAGAGTVAGAVG
jgi:hypothetical protein